jgi:hypothetical protein
MKTCQREKVGRSEWAIFAIQGLRVENRKLLPSVEIWDEAFAIKKRTSLLLEKLSVLKDKFGPTLTNSFMKMKIYEMVASSL